MLTIQISNWSTKNPRGRESDSFVQEHMAIPVPTPIRQDARTHFATYEVKGVLSK